MQFKLISDFPKLDESIKLYSGTSRKALTELNELYFTQPLYEVRANTKYIRNNLVQKFIAQNGIDFRGTPINGIDDVAILAKIFRDTRYETTRIFYVKDKHIVGSDGVSSKIPDRSAIFPKFKSAANDNENQFRGWTYYNQKRIRLSADGYYLIHNHPSGNPTPSNNDLVITKLFQENIPGFLGHIILGKNSYGIIDIDLQFHTNQFDDNFIADEENFTWNPDAVARIASQYINSSDYSILLYSNSQQNVVAIQEIKNSELADKNIGRYIANQKRENGAVFCYLCTSDGNLANTYSISENVINNILTDIVFIKGSRVYSIRDINLLPIDQAYNILGKKDNKVYKVRES